MEEIAQLIKGAKNSDSDAMAILLMKFNHLILKHSKDQYGHFDEDCYQALAERFVKAVHCFELDKYVEK